ncbi:hypothetical protein [Legionella tucsonensis]|uniref:Uncharacterized protein n=1 Tax=Legionella tucsonensis TaxID=40335 RepID=A0A0W0ZQ74_9GAMM|nr:hypothetical protein [Legionella tucsonensis]KTD71309.1 hypothetical protein Ltuc_2668 [Legionella tucsonensis]
MKSKYQRFAINTALAQGLFSWKKITFESNFFLRKELGSSRNYHVNLQNKWTISSYFFPQTSFRGDRVSNYESVLSHLPLGNKNIRWLGMCEKKIDESTHKKLFGLIGKRPILTCHEDETIERKETDEQMKRRTVDVNELANTERLDKGFKFASFLIQSNQIQLAIDLNNIPKDEIYYPNTNNLSNDIKTLKATEMTLPAVHISAILMRILKSGLTTLKIEYNPFYVDQHLLSKELKVEYALLTKKFYSVVL